MIARESNRRLFLSAFAVLITSFSAVSFAADPPKETKITVTGLHCAGCAKKVKAKLASVANVKSAEVDHKTGLATVVPVDAMKASPRSLWEAVEKADAKPTRLEGPDGIFTSKPKA
ncbi:heavy-metal-associated domain-containing protein [bacterium]|nr:heavy-metal-associated domain-containing protein [bacterium]